MKLVKALSVAFAAIVGFVVIVAHATITPPGTTGPSLGDANANISTLTTAVTLFNQNGFSAGVSISQTSGQANCTQLSGNPIQEIKTSAATGYVCLPTAIAGRVVWLGNATGQTVNIYSSATSFTPGTADNINGTAGTTLYGGLTSGKTAMCTSASNGNWYCLSGS